MLAHSAEHTHQQSGFDSEAQSTDRQLVLMILAVLVTQILVYRPAFGITPWGEDYILAVQGRIGEQRGAWSFFIGSPLADYRPLQALTYWAFGRWQIENPFPLIHILSFAAFSFYAFVFALWIRLCSLPRSGTLCALVVLFLHPVLAGPLADLDGFTRFVVSGWVWLGAYFAFKYADRLSIAIPLTSICFVIGLGFMEYAVALVPLSILAVWWGGAGRQTRKIRAALALSLTLLVLFAAYYFVRISVIGYSDAGRLSFNPVEWARNFVMLSVAVLFMGDTVPVYVQRGGALVAAAISVTLMSLMLFGGLWLWHRAERDRQGAIHTQGPTAKVFPFLVTAMLIPFFPMVFMGHISEIYATPILFVLALLTGFAVAGWAQAPRKYVVAALLVLVFHTVWACVSVRAKVGGVRAASERAGVFTRDLLGKIPSEAHDLRVALVFLDSELPDRPYSVFAPGDDLFIAPDVAARAAMEWLRPGKNIELLHLIVDDKSAVQLEDFDMVLYWNPSNQRFESWKEL
jgi:hypothetical protein